MRANSGQTAFTSAGFTGSYTIRRPPNGNYIIAAQSLVGGQQYACNASVIVFGPTEEE